MNSDRFNLRHIIRVLGSFPVLILILVAAVPYIRAPDAASGEGWSLASWRISVAIPSVAAAFDSGFWYGGTRGPFVYDSVPYANLTIRIDRPWDEGPGLHLFRDPVYRDAGLFVGNTINRQSFDTQFILDMEHALGVSRNRVYVTNVEQGRVHFSWEAKNVIVEFILLERNASNPREATLMEIIARLTTMIQVPTSKLYVGTNVTKDIDHMYGLDVLTWDVSLRLSYPIEIIGRDSVIDGYYLNQGSLGFCDQLSAVFHTEYCEFERFFEDDVSEALNITYHRIQILFIKRASLDAVLVHFRIEPPMQDSDELTIQEAVAELMYQVGDKTSALFAGNVTIRVDPLWGVSNNGPVLRKSEALFSYKYYDYDPRHLSTDRVEEARRPQPLVTAYDRCKANRRCNWGEKEHNQTTNDIRFFHRIYDLGEKWDVSLFLDFEDWRLGTRGFSWDGSIPPTQDNASSIANPRMEYKRIRGAHIWPFAERSLGPDLPCYLLERNQGLVLDRRMLHHQIGYQEALVYDLEGRVQWIEENIEFAKMDAMRRSRRDVKHYMIGQRTHFLHWLNNEDAELQELKVSQCVLKKCYLLFNTTSLTLTGAIEDVGVLRKTSNGTEIAVFTFNSIILGPDITIEVVGQRAIVLVSKTAFILNTTISLYPGTVGGFPGGYSVARKVDESLIDTPRDVLICDLVGYCNVNDTVSTPYIPVSQKDRLKLISNNVNGPGSGNLRNHPFVIRTYADDIDEIQTVTTTAQEGQTLEGGFKLHYGQYSTPVIPCDASAGAVKRIIEDNLNLMNPGVFPISSKRYENENAGVGLVNVTRSNRDNNGGYVWTITFKTVIGNIQQLRVTNFLQALKANVVVRTIRDGNELGGSFKISFMNQITRPIPHNATASTVKDALLALPTVRTAYVIRNDPVRNCDDGLCMNGPLQSRAFIWSIYVTTDASSDNHSPSSPTSPLARAQMNTSQMSLDFSLLTGAGAGMKLDRGMATSPHAFLALLNITFPFSLAYGGGGGSFGGHGGKGYGDNPVGPVYSDEKLTDLLGGSGGCMRTQHPFEINAFLNSVAGRGGDGGGAIQLVTANDMTIGSFGKIIARGEDGEQTSEGGGGGGSGGAISLAAGGVVIVDGMLDVRGGDGGYGGIGLEVATGEIDTDERKRINVAGGGGGGGRISIFGESIIIRGNVNVEGGNCGVYKIDAMRNVYAVNVSLLTSLRGPMVEYDIKHVTQQFIDFSLPNLVSELTFIKVDEGKSAIVNYSLIIDRDKYTIEKLRSSLSAAEYMIIADVVFVDAVITSYTSTETFLPTSSPTQCSNNGGSGTLYTETQMTSRMEVMETDAAEGTGHALFLSNNEITKTATGSVREAPFSWNGPTIPFLPARPTRVTYYSRLVSIPGESLKSNFGTLFSLISRGSSDANISSVIGVFIGDKIMHGHNFIANVNEANFLKRMFTIDEYPAFDRWYKVDIHIRWETHTYFILLDDTLVVKDVSFQGNDVDGIRLSVDRAASVWFDEIYVGFDNNLNFECPRVERAGAEAGIPLQRGWALDEVNAEGSEGYTEVQKMTRHYSHLEVANHVLFDGQGQVKVFEDIKLKFPTGDYKNEMGKMHAGTLRYLKNSQRSSRKPNGNSATTVSPKGLWNLAKDGSGKGGAGDGRQYWYTEHNVQVMTPDIYSLGGIAACSSQDLQKWRFEGILMHYENLTDMVMGTTGPFTLERPAVLFNNLTQKYIMWATMNDANHSQGMTIVAESPYEDGPFLFRRSFYPDGNKTRDQSIFVSATGPVLARTYYLNVEYIAPEAIMQPVWESVKNRDGTTNYRLNYHRAWYELGYDNFHDIYLQRWRMEDKEYDVTCVNVITGEQRHVKYGEYNDEDSICQDATEYKIVVGLGNPAVQTKFLSPNSSDNSWWMQTSVPAVKAQPWASSYRDGYCGIRQLQNFIDVNDPVLAEFEPNNLQNCSNIGDNPVHMSLQDKLLGVQKILMQRRAKYVAVSQLSDDFLDTSGIMTSFEGELSSGNLVTMIADMGQFGFEAGDKIKSTFVNPVRSGYETAYDYRTRFRQYIVNKNDRAQYSLACVVDGVCPNNFKDYLTYGNI